MVAVSDDELRQLRESAEKYRTMIDQASDAILAISPEDGQILEANRKTEEMTGYAPNELVGMKVWDLHPPQERAEAKRLSTGLPLPETDPSVIFTFAERTGR